MIKEYHLYKDDYAKLQLDLHDAFSYCQKNEEHCFQSHRHSYFQLIWFRSEGQHFVDYKAYTHPEDAVFVLSPGQVHHFCKNSANIGTLIHFNDIFLYRDEKSASQHLKYRIFDSTTDPLITVPKEHVQQLQSLIDRIQVEIEKKPFNYKQQLFHYLHTILLTIERLHLVEGLEIKQSSNNKLAAQFKLLVQENIGSFKTVGELAGMLGVNAKKLSQVTKQFYNRTPSQFIHKSKIIEAKRLLINTDLAIKEIAFRLGFEQATYFTKYFKKHTGYTPKQFQKNHH